MLITNLEIEAKGWELSYNACNNGLVPYDFSSPEKNVNKVNLHAANA
jgi:hypothetical protein